MTEGNSLLPPFRTRPPVSTRQAEVMAARLFNLNIADPTSIKEMDSYQDRNFYMRGSLMRGDEKMGVSPCKEYVLKVINHVDSNNGCLIEVQGKLMVFLQARGYNCCTPVPSISTTLFVKCKIPRCAQDASVSLETDSIALETNGVALEGDSVALKTDGVALETNGVALERYSVSLETDGVALETNGVALEGDNVALETACVALEIGSGPVESNNNRCFDTLHSVNSTRSLVGGIEIYDGKDYSKEEYFVCAVLLLNFVRGKTLNEIPLNTELLFNAGMTVGRLDQDLMDFGCSRLDRPGFLWNISRFVDNVERCLQAVDDKHHVKMVREVCESFRQEVAPKLHLLPKHIIHGDASYSNIVVTPEKEIGLIDFGEMSYTCHIFELAISLMYILNVKDYLSCGRTRTAGYFFRGISLG
ncbi:hypothetical protein OS493_011437 [Desmophyllum pertusum]|uniref:Hydroxylysine kinase n=1 Tax=Desmophyllum pertusum TaxID=174260 RepID=A0A9X0CNC1_9CNID|nr:hypothetical protein OS493_011437 [Desmophyllum pertusum]